MRLNDWQSRLAAVISERWSMPFAWGSQDCVTFASVCVLAVTGADHLAGMKWADERAAARALKKVGGLRAAVASKLGAEIPLAMVQPGDVGMFADAGRDTLTVWAGSAWLSTGEHGLVVIDPAALVTAWRCGGSA